MFLANFFLSGQILNIFLTTKKRKGSKQANRIKLCGESNFTWQCDSFWDQPFSGITGKGRGAEFPPRLLTGKFLLTYREKEARKKGKRGENGEEKKENYKKEGGKLKMEGGKVTKWGEEFFFFFFSLFKTTKICFGSTKMEIFYQETTFHARKKNRPWNLLFLAFHILSLDQAFRTGNRQGQISATVVFFFFYSFSL